MNDHIQDKIPFYVNGQLRIEERTEMEKHLVACSDCRAELQAWESLAGAVQAVDSPIQAPAGLVDRALESIQSLPSHKQRFMAAFSLLRAQAYLVKSEMWPASAALMALGVTVALISKQVIVLTFIAPLIAAACLAAIYGPENDPASELTCSTPTSPWKILLARLALVSSYNLLLTFAASLFLLTIVPVELFGAVALNWLGPLAFLSALALLLSLWIGTSNAITLSYGLWIAQYLHFPQALQVLPALKIWASFLTSYRQFWQSPVLLLLLALAVVGIALLSVGRSERMLTPYST